MLLLLFKICMPTREKLLDTLAIMKENPKEDFCPAGWLLIHKQDVTNQDNEQ